MILSLIVKYMNQAFMDSLLLLMSMVRVVKICV